MIIHIFTHHSCNYCRVVQFSLLKFSWEEFLSVLQNYNILHAFKPSVWNICWIIIFLLADPAVINECMRRLIFHIFSNELPSVYCLLLVRTSLTILHIVSRLLLKYWKLRICQSESENVSKTIIVIMWKSTVRAKRLISVLCNFFLVGSRIFNVRWWYGSSHQGYFN